MNYAEHQILSESEASLIFCFLTERRKLGRYNQCMPSLSHVCRTAGSYFKKGSKCVTLKTEPYRTAIIIHYFAVSQRCDGRKFANCLQKWGNGYYQENDDDILSDN
jgi:hypothetical protein